MNVWLIIILAVTFFIVSVLSGYYIEKYFKKDHDNAVRLLIGLLLVLIWAAFLLGMTLRDFIVR